MHYHKAIASVREGVLALSTAHNSTVQDLTSQLQQERDKVAILRVELESLQQLNTQLQDAMHTDLRAARQHTATLATLREERARHTEQREELQQQIQHLVQQLDDAQAALQKATSAATTHEEECTSLRHTLHTLQAAAEQAQANAVQEANALRQRLSEATTELAQCTQRCTTLQSEITTLQAALATARHNESQLQTTLDKERGQPTIINTSAAVWKNKCIKLRSEVEALRAQLQQNTATV